MNLTAARVERDAGQRRAGKTKAFLGLLLVSLLSGCTVLSNSTSFYQDRRPGPINWRQYTSD